MKKQLIHLIVVLISVGAMAANGAQTIRELWDQFPSGQLQGATNGNTSLGYYPNATIKWTVNPADPAGTNALIIRSDANVEDWTIGRYDTLPSSWTDAGDMSLAGTTNGFDTGSWAVRFLDTPARINTAVDGVYYFSARLIKRSLWWYDAPPGGNTNNFGPDDAALGIGFAAGNSASSHFIGAGFTRTVAANGGAGYLTADGGTDIGDTVYITQGTLGQAGFANHPSDSGGPFYVRAYGYPQWVEGYLGGYPSMDQKYVNGGFLVGKLTTSAAGSDQLQVYTFVDGENVPTDDAGITWDVTYSFNESSSLSYLLVWMSATNHGGNSCDIDAIRVGTRYADVIGLETFGPTASPTNRVYEGTPLSLTVTGILGDTNSSSYQWLKAGGFINNATNSTYTIASPATTNSGSYSAIYSNAFGVATSQVLTVTVDPYASPIITTEPLDQTRYLGATSNYFRVVADGGRPLNYLWKHIVGSVTNVMSGQTNPILVLTNLQAGDAGGYFATVTNLAGSTNSSVAAMNVIVPAPGSYAAQVLANNPWGYWMLDEAYGTTNLHDFYGGHDGWLDPTNSGVDGTNPFTWGVYQQQPAAQLPGFPANHVGIYVPHNGYEAHAQVPGVSNYTPNMTWMGWILATSPGANELGEGGAFLWNRDYNDNGGYGNAFGLTFIQNTTGGSTNDNEIAYRWGGSAENPTQAWAGYYFHTGLFAPTSTWCFVAVTWAASNNATVYLGSPNGPLTAATAALPATFDSGYPGASYQNSFDILLGRGGYPWADGLVNANNQTGVSLSDVAVFTNALSSNAVYQIYLGATGELLTYTNLAGNLVVSWPWGTLFSSTNAGGPYSPVAGATSPYTASKTGARKFFRVQR